MSFNCFNHYSNKTFHLNFINYSSQFNMTSFKVTFSPRTYYDKNQLYNVKTMSELFNFFGEDFDNSTMQDFQISFSNFTITTHVQNFSLNTSLKNKDICILEYNIISEIKLNELIFEKDTNIISEKDLWF